MKFSLNWLKQHLETTKTADELSEVLVRLGHEVEAMEAEGEAFNNVVVGHVLERAQHPDADKLGVCKVDVGEENPRQIVCGAANVRAGLTVAVAIEGAVLPGDFKIKKSKIRGVESCGMICSERELGLGQDHEGIWELDVDAKVGTPLATALGLDDVVFETSLTPNRGDALSVRGTARDLAAAGAGELVKLPEISVGSASSKVAPTTESENCPYFCGITVSGVNNKVATPAWMVKRLEQGGMRSVDNVIVDITNFVMLDLGQPLHAYDTSKLNGNLKAVVAKDGEEFVGVVGDNKITLNAGDIAIADESGVVGLAGIMGGKNTDVDENTQEIFIEAAWFNKVQIAKTGQKHNIISDARYRFERGIDPSMTPYVAKRAAQLVAEICGGEMSKLVETGDNSKFVEITFRPERVKDFGGLDIDHEEIKTALRKLGFEVQNAGSAYNVVAPTWATIMETEEDLVEEVLRLVGYDAVPAVLPKIPAKRVETSTNLTKVNFQARRQLAVQGYLEAINYSFISKQKAELFAQGQELIELSNPIDEETMSTMRPSLLPGLLDSLAKNAARSEQVERMAEVGKVFNTQTETLMAAGVAQPSASRHWQAGSVKPDVFTAKADAIELIASFGARADKLQVKQGASSFFHPGRSGQLCQGREVVAEFGELHPTAMKICDLKKGVVGFTVNLEAVAKMKVRTGQFTRSDFQPVKRDLAFVVDENTPAGDLLQTISGADKQLTKSVELFDVYTGENVEEGKKSLAFTLTLQADDRTLTDEEINAVVEKAVSSANKRCGAVLRDA